LPGPILAQSTVCKISRFVQKPDLQTAEYYIKNGYLWNSGNFLFSINSGCEEISALAPETYAATSQAMAKAQVSDHGLLLDRESFSTAPRISFDYAVMEKTIRSAVLPVGYAWSDIGSWDAVAAPAPKNQHANSAIGKQKSEIREMCLCIPKTS
jgi:mannose-1-phosphate guanylyltransferase